MVDIKKLLGLRPKDTSSAGLANALAAARRDLEATEARLAMLNERRGDLLLDGGDAEVRAAEEQLARDRADADRLRTLVEVLERRQVAAARDEEVARFERRAEDLRVRADALRHRLQEEYVKHASAIAALMAAEVAWCRDRRGYSDDMKTALSVDV